MCSESQDGKHVDRESLLTWVEAAKRSEGRKQTIVDSPLHCPQEPPQWSQTGVAAEKEEVRKKTVRVKKKC